MTDAFLMRMESATHTTRVPFYEYFKLRLTQIVLLLRLAMTGKAI